MPDQHRAARETGAALEAGPLLILAPTGRDAADATALLARAGVGCRACDDLNALCEALGEETGAVLVADEAFARTGPGPLSMRLRSQPPWSDLPVLVLTGRGAAARRAVELDLAEALGNAVFVERPLGALGLVSVVRSALRARQRQRQVGAHVAEQARAAAALAEGEARLRALINATSDALFRKSPDWSETWAIDARARPAGLGAGPSEDRTEDASHGPERGAPWPDADMDPADRERVRATLLHALAERRPFEAEFRTRRPDGAVRWTLARAVPLLGADGEVREWFGASSDVTARREAEELLRRANETLEARVAERTAELRGAVAALRAAALERERAEEQLRQAQKMEAVGQLTGGIAHDFNNMLQAIAGSLDMVHRRLAEGRLADANRYVEVGQKAAGRAAALTQRLLAFARRQALQPGRIDLDALVAGTTELVRRTMGPSVIVELRAGNESWPVLCDANQLESALLNLAINARDAMPEGGRLTIGTAKVQLAAADVAGEDGVPPGDYVEIAVTDTGKGMDAATRARAFEPFFTTKAAGQGTGLGLSQIHGFVRQSGGIVRLESAPGRGTTVRLYLPRHVPEPNAASADAQAGGTDSARAIDPRVGGRETILLVEDETDVRDAATERLRELGYRVLEAQDGPSALRLLERGVAIDLLVTDVGLPGGLNGRQVADAARQRRPGLPVLFVTGYAGGALDERLAPGMTIISKPFALDRLTAAARSALDAAPDAPAKRTEAAEATA